MNRKENKIARGLSFSQQTKADTADRESQDDRSSSHKKDCATSLPCMSRFKLGALRGFQASVTRPAPTVIAFEDALRIKSAEFWLRLGEPLEALADIQELPPSVRRSSWVHRLHAAATRAVTMTSWKSAP
jgi:hypothetical protein